MALVERLMHDPSEPDSRWIPVHQFFAAITELMSGQLTANQVQTFYNMTPADLVDWNAIVATMPPQSQAANRSLFMNRIHAVFLLAEDNIPLYSTPAEVRTRLGI